MHAASWKTRTAAMGMVVLVALGAVACSSTNSSTTTTTAATSGGGGGSGSSKIPQSAFSDHTGISSSSVSVANVSTLTAGLFKGASVGTQAYADYVNSTGGVNGRKIVVQAGDDGFSGATNKQLTQSALESDFALVGGFSLEDSFGGTVLAQNPGMPDVAVTLSPTTNQLPNVFSAVPLDGGWETGPLEYFKAKFPKDVNYAAALVADSPSAETDWAGEKYAMEKVGFKVIYDPIYAVTQTDFTPNVVAMKSAGVKILFLDQMPENYAAAVLKALVQQNFHPQVILGAANYSNALIPNAGGASAVNGALLDQNTSLYLGQDASVIPAVGLFNKWVNVASPGFKPDLFTLYGWLSAELFANALKNAGADPSRGSLLQALSKITTFSGNDIVAPANPAAKTVGNCYLIGQVANGDFERLDTPPPTSSSNGYRCGGEYVTPPGS